MWSGMVWHGGMGCGVACGVVWWYGMWCGMVWYGVVWGGMVWFSVVCVVWCVLENRGLPELGPDESSGTSLWGEMHQIAVRVWWDGWFVVGGGIWWYGMVWYGLM